MTRLLLAYPGGEVTLFQYKRAVPDHDVGRKMATIASELFPAWGWAEDGEIPAIWDLTDENRAILAVDGPRGKECFL